MTDTTYKRRASPFLIGYYRKRSVMSREFNCRVIVDRGDGTPIQLSERLTFRGPSSSVIRSLTDPGCGTVAVGHGIRPTLTVMLAMRIPPAI